MITPGLVYKSPHTLLIFGFKSASGIQGTPHLQMGQWCWYLQFAGISFRYMRVVSGSWLYGICYSWSGENSFIAVGIAAIRRRRDLLFALLVLSFFI